MVILSKYKLSLKRTTHFSLIAVLSLLLLGSPSEAGRGKNSFGDIQEKLLAKKKKTPSKKKVEKRKKRKRLEATEADNTTGFVSDINTQGASQKEHRHDPEEDAYFLAQITALENEYTAEKAKQAQDDASFLAAIDAIESDYFSRKTPPSSPSSSSPVSSQTTQASSPSNDNRQMSRVARRLVTESDHTDFLQQTLATARNTIMISTYSLSSRRLLREGIGQSIIDAKRRGVKIYIYYKNIQCSDEDNDGLNRIASFCDKFEANDNHSKCVIKDNETVAIGSYNWLAESRDNSSNATLVVKGRLVPRLKEDIWQGIRFYQSIKHDNIGGLVNFLKNDDAFSMAEHEFEPGQFFYTLRTPEAHGELLQRVFQNAQDSIQLTSPFIRLGKLEATLTPQLLETLQLRGVKLQLITLSSPCDRLPQEEFKIFDYLERASNIYPNFSYTTQSDLHAKSLISDTNLVCEGSHNWLSAVMDLDHHSNNFEMSIAFRGPIATSLIQSTEDGKSLSSSQSSSVSPLKQKQRSRSASRDFIASHKKSFKKPYFSSHSEPVIDVLSGERVGKEGFCARLNGDYITDEYGSIVYFYTPEDAEQAAYDCWSM